MTVFSSNSMSAKTLNFDEAEISKDRFRGSKQPTDLNLVEVHKIVRAYKIQHGDKSLEYFVGNSDGNIT